MIHCYRIECNCRENAVVHFDCHPEQAFFAQRRIWASRAKGYVLCDPIVARLARFLVKLHHYGLLTGLAHGRLKLVLLGFALRGGSSARRLSIEVSARAVIKRSMHINPDLSVRIARVSHFPGWSFRQPKADE